MKRAVLAAAAVAVATAAALGMADRGVRAATTAARASSHVAVIPGFHAPVYSGTNGLPVFPTDAAGLGAYSFTELGPSSVTATSLKNYDTVILYGQRWNSLPSDAQSAINAFAKTGKVLIWDSDSTGAQSYGSFLHPFSTSASGEDGAKAGSVVTYPTGDDPFASSDPSSPAYLSPSALTSDDHLIAHMNVMDAGAAEWAPALVAANKEIPGGGWVLAWSYGVTGDHSGLVVYSGLDADAFHDPAPNNAIKELALELGQPFLRSADTSCAPNCAPPNATTSGGGSGGGGSGGSGGGSGGSGGGSGGSGGGTGGGSGGGGGGGSGGGGGGGTTFAQCSFLRKTTVWVHGRVPVLLTTSVAAGLGARPETAKGKLLGALVVPVGGRAMLTVNSKLLPSNRASSFLGVLYVNGAKACTATTTLKVDNIPPRLLGLKVHHSSGQTYLQLRASEAVTVTGLGRAVSVPGRKTAYINLPVSHGSAKVALRDRAGNTLKKKLTW